MTSRIINKIGLVIDPDKFKVFNNILLHNVELDQFDLSNTVNYNNQLSNINPVLVLLRDFELPLKTAYIKATCKCDSFNHLDEHRLLDVSGYELSDSNNTIYMVIKSDYYVDYISELKTELDLQLDLIDYEFRVPIVTLSNLSIADSMLTRVATTIGDSINITGLAFLYDNNILLTDSLL